MIVGAFKLNDKAITPTYGSDSAACFDLYACLVENTSIGCYNENNEKLSKYVLHQQFTVYSGERVLVPTGFIFDIPEDHSMRIHPRSGLSLKNGIVVANCEGIVDADYVQQTYVMLLNISDKPFTICDGDRIAQGEMTPVFRPEVILSDSAPEEKTNRTGGFGSTGV